VGENEARALSAVVPEVQRCLRGHAELQRKAPVVRVSFTPRSDGRFSDVVIEPALQPQPYLRACLEDVFSEVQFVPKPEAPFERLTRWFDTAVSDPGPNPPKEPQAAPGARREQARWPVIDE
jgi:hypothetical protein